MIQPEKYYEYVDVAYNSKMNSFYETFANPQDCNTKSCNLNPDIVSRDCDTANNNDSVFKSRNCNNDNGFSCGNTINFILNAQNATNNTNNSNDDKKRILENLQCIANQFSEMSKY